MTTELFTGNSIVVKVVSLIAAIFVVSDILITVFTIFYQRIMYKKFVKPRFESTYTPTCAVIVPCKGNSKDLEKNLRGFLDFDYPDYKVIYAVESETDKAVLVIKKIMAENARADLAVAGLSTKCVQKNHNILAGLAKASDAEVYAFADADIKPEPSWLKEMVLPLSSQKVAVTSGFRWLISNKGNIGELAHFYVNTVIYVFFTVACFFGGVGLWGGSMAIRKKDFVKLHVGEKWSRAGVDDMSLSHMVLKAHQKAIIVPTCITKTNDLISDLKGTVAWFERQIMYLKAYQKLLWLVIGFPMVITGLLLILLLPVSLIMVLFFNKTFFDAGGGAAIIFYLGEFLTITLYRFLGPVHSLARFYALWPILRFSQGISYIRTAFTNTILWAGVKYKISFNGDVSSVERL